MWVMLEHRVHRLSLFTAALSLAAGSAAADSAATAIESQGLVGTWATYCTPSTDRGKPGLRIVFAAPPDGPPIYTTVSSDGRATTTVRSEVLEASPVGSSQLKLRLRIVGGDVDGGPLPDTMTSTFEQVLDKTEEGIRLVGVDPRFIQKCPAQ